MFNRRVNKEPATGGSGAAEADAERHRISRGLYRLGSCIVLVDNAIVVLWNVQLFFIPAGTGLRPMGWAVALFALAFLAVGAVPLVLPYAVYILRNSRNFSGLLLVVLCFTPLPVGAFLLHFLADKLHLYLEE
jgi:hypothetical protein